MRTAALILTTASGLPGLTAQDAPEPLSPTLQEPEVFARAAPDPPADRRWHTRLAVWKMLEGDPRREQNAWRKEIDRRLAQWVAQQNADGSFGNEDQDLIRFTALTTLAFSLRGYTLDDETHGAMLRRSVGWLLQHQGEDGAFKTADAPAELRTQAQATFALIDVSYSPDYPDWEYPGIMTRARRALDRLDTMTDATEAEIWLIGARAYAERAALRPPSTRGAPAEGAALDWKESVVRVLVRENTSAAGLELHSLLPGEELLQRFSGRDLDDSFFAGMACAHSHPLQQDEVCRVVSAWLRGEEVAGWEAADRDPIELNHRNLLRTLQLESAFLIHLKKRQR